PNLHECSKGIHGIFRVDRPDSQTHELGHSSGIDTGSYQEPSASPELLEGEIKLLRGFAIQPVLPDVSYYPYNCDPSLAAVERNPSPDGVLATPVTACHPLIHHRHRRGIGMIRVREGAPPEQRDAKGPELFRRYPI